jgi:hypothetical protein
LPPKFEALRDEPPEREEPKDEFPNAPELPKDGCATLDPGGLKLRDVGEELIGEAPLRAKLLEEGVFVDPRIDEPEVLGPRAELPAPKECQPPSLRAEVEGELNPRAAGEL